MALTEESKITAEIDDCGCIHLKTTTKVFRDGVQLGGNSIHRKVLNVDDGDYSDKLAEVTTALVGQLAIDQQVIIAQKEEEKNALGALNQTLATNLAAEKLRADTAEGKIK